jgi:hypothetical protein
METTAASTSFRLFSMVSQAHRCQIRRRRAAATWPHFPAGSTVARSPTPTTPGEGYAIAPPTSGDRLLVVKMRNQEVTILLLREGPPLSSADMSYHASRPCFQPRVQDGKRPRFGPSAARMGG